MKRPVKHSDGAYHLEGKTFKVLSGSRQQVWNKTAHHTPGGLKRSQLMMNKRGRIVSKKKHLTAKKENGKRFKAKGYELTRKKKFGPTKMKNRKTSRKKN
tara:strand:- start:31589 stop:31888 length:300 start_codon:yes stop_codon:yes gene_type:complete